MPMNTPYLGMVVSVQSNMNTPYLINGLTGLPSAVTITGPLDTNSQHSRSNFYSYHTTGSATSLNLSDGAFGIYFESVTSARLVFRSGVTIYSWIATTGGVL